MTPQAKQWELIHEIALMLWALSKASARIESLLGVSLQKADLKEIDNALIHKLVNLEYRPCACSGEHAV
ncbi:hypothetical protein LCGC14_0264210 [marine sediment metagenome]|uniref:Uncharacterized protein n=1 Tax=marine sediment metagenome TaxID=412755 RepID=A0A0F9UHP8_9ZZZZ